jgi:hypothetical protein
MMAKNVQQVGTTNGRTLTFTVRESSLRRAPNTSASPMRVPRDAQEPKSGGSKSANRTP